ncbi:MAG: heavy metal translocating P-type ATPase metal-binding domain-containing protein [Bacteroidetes bacterium]|nr:heavy metal translocating P-type ATPase metal-binding domain-containing protein [Bacteroidota bacterium]MBP6402367.1 heavy metal translocating P-type ATPase metal-binding domain-containing protein [Bacteroidia bacterium]MBP6648809.1 heavy metal translocating P-type ATPase metal-binding domain-containing protein [Bacteroidia bacterium]
MVTIETALTCYHCGEDCKDEVIRRDDKVFCCEGCKLVFEILQENNLCSYYQYNASPGQSPKGRFLEEKYAFLDDDQVRKKLVNFTDGKYTTINFYIPQMHCSSCIWLLEHLSRINSAVVRSQVNFLKRETIVVFEEQKISLRQVVEMLTMIGYEPVINLNDLENRQAAPKNRTRIYKIGIAGFAFGNIMLFSFPEYFSLSDYIDPGFKGVFSYINLALSLPVFFYCSSQFFVSAFASLKQKFLNIDVPIALGILVMFVRSLLEIATATGAGYLDTMSGLVFFMLLGRMFQDKTYETLSFERDYKSFFPIAVMCRKEGRETSIPVSQLKIGDRILIRNEELVPADAVLIKGSAQIDYSFVTGESIPVERKSGELIYAGGKQKGALVELEVVKEVSQSYLTQLWNKDAYLQKHDDGKFQQLVNQISHYFTFVIVALSLLALGFWFLQGDHLRGWNAFTAVLIIACPCALAISSPFTLGNILRIFGRNEFYLKNFAVIEKLAKISTIVFDKTGTLTHNNSASVNFHGDPLTEEETLKVRSLVHQSSHPLSQLIFKSIKGSSLKLVNDYMEIPGEGLSGNVGDSKVRLGSAAFTATAIEFTADQDLTTKVFLSINNLPRGYFSFKNNYREGLVELVEYLKRKKFELVVLSGDNEGEKKYLSKVFGTQASILFRQTPANKLKAIQELQQDGKHVLMIGDGLNDAGALKQSDVGISISDDINNFSPACDAILNAGKFRWLGSILAISRASHRIILGSFVIALGYNFIGLYFAMQGTLSPVIAAILMPISSISIIAFTTGMSNFIARR